MKLHIQNLGPIKAATIDLSKRFYTFVGYNNSGKTYLANLLWCVFNYDNNVNIANTLYEIGKGGFKEFTEGKYEIIISQELLNRLLSEFAISIKRIGLPEILNISKDHFAIQNLELQFDGKIEQIDMNYFEDLALSGFIATKKDNEIIVKWGLNKDSNEFFYGKENYKHIILRVLNSLLHTPFQARLYFLPTERLSFMYFHKYFFRIEKERREEINRYLQTKNGKNWEALEELSESPYSESSSELIDRIYKLSVMNNIENIANNDLLSQLEPIMGGKIILEPSKSNGDTNFRFQMPANQDNLKLHLASSSINQLSTLYLYWKYWANNSDNFLMIDEPEQNLHPDNQIKLTELLIQFANRNNNRVLIATHSPLIADVINNYLVLGQLENKEETRIKLGMAENAFLTPENTGIYFFTGEKVVEYKVSDYGTTFADFKAAQEKVWDAGYELGNLMYQQLKKKVDVEN